MRVALEASFVPMHLCRVRVFPACLSWQLRRVRQEGVEVEHDALEVRNQHGGQLVQAHTDVDLYLLCAHVAAARIDRQETRERDTGA